MYWSHALEFAEEAEHEGVTLRPVEEITRAASITGSTAPVCGQRAPVVATPPPTPSEFKQNWTIVATDNKFDIGAIGINANQPATVTLQNRGAAIHNWAVQGVQSTTGQPIETQLLPGGQSQTIMFTVAMPGTYRFLCTVHPTEMVGSLVVQ
jgi:plastocyanin